MEDVIENGHVKISLAEAALFRALIDEKAFPGAASGAVSKLRNKLPVEQVQLSGDRFVVPEKGD